MMINDGVLPANKDQGYILRRLIRRAVMKMRSLHSGSLFHELVSLIYDKYKSTPYLTKSEEQTFDVIFTEEIKFRKTLEQGLKEFEKGTDPFILATTYGFPIEITEELAMEKNMSIDRIAFDEKMKAHQDASRAGAAAKFKGGLADTGEKTTKLHTTHHLLLAALQKVLGPEVHQRGSNITAERLRIDFNFDRKMTDEEKKQLKTRSMNGYRLTILCADEKCLVQKLNSLVLKWNLEQNIPILFLYMSSKMKTATLFQKNSAVVLMLSKLLVSEYSKFKKKKQSLPAFAASKQHFRNFFVILIVCLPSRLRLRFLILARVVSVVRMH